MATVKVFCHKHTDQQTESQTGQKQDPKVNSGWHKKSFDLETGNVQGQGQTRVTMDQSLNTC